MISALSKGRVQILRQGGLYIAYSHSLDISTTGKSELQAQERIDDVVAICTKARIQKSGVTHKLAELGWTQKSKRWCPPEAKVPAAAKTAKTVKVAKKGKK